MKSNASSIFSFRTKVLSILILIFASILIGKLFLVQIIHREAFADEANKQYFTPSAGVFERGTIFFKTKDGSLVSAATQMAGFKLVVNPSEISDPEDVYKKLSTKLSINQEEFLKKTEDRNDTYAEIIDHLSQKQMEAISLLKIRGVSLVKEKWRFYPGGSLASHTLGLVGYKGDELGGRYGLERQYDDELSRNKDNPYINFFAEVFSNIKENFSSPEEKDGDIITTIEPSVQGFLEKELSQVKAKWAVDSIGGIIMNPKDGAIYAMGALPQFDPNDFSGENISVFANPLVERVLEFGSVVKPLVMAGALDAGAVTAGTAYNDTGSVWIEKKEIFNFDKKGRGPDTTMQEVLGESLNTGMVFVYQKLGKEKLREYLYSFGIKDRTGINLPNETSGLTSNLDIKSSREIEYANASFGQGIAMTPISVVRSLASLSNGGYLVTPHVVDSIKYNNGISKKIIYPDPVQTKISAETSEEITRMLVEVMDKSLKGGLAKLEHNSIAVKTGTAQVANLEGGGYYEDKHTHSFVGYFPAYDPEFIIFLYAVNPKGVQYASQTWADPFLSITKFLLNYYKILPDR